MQNPASLPIGDKAEFTVDFVCPQASVVPQARLYVGWTLYPDRPQWDNAVLSIHYADDTCLARSLDPRRFSFEQLVIMAKQLTWRTVRADDLTAIGWTHQ